MSTPRPATIPLSAWIWFAVCTLIVLWLPLLAMVRLFDRDPAWYRTGRTFRLLGVAMTKVNPLWRVERSGVTIDRPRNPYVVVSNHQSFADIPIVSHVPWEMKWVGKRELFRLPVIGWMMKLAGDIPLDRADRHSGMKMLLTAESVLKRKCSVIIFPEGTRSHDGRVGRFNDGAFHLAIRAGVPVIPLALDGSGDCLPKHSWKFGPPSNIRLRVLPPVSTEGMTTNDVPALRDRVRGDIIRQVAAWRNADAAAVDALIAHTADDPPIPS